MTLQRICLTIDADPDGLSGRTRNRQALSWKGLSQIRVLLDEIESAGPSLGRVPITWFVRADGQLRDLLGSPLYLFETFDCVWNEVRGAGHELGWHPHLYSQKCATDTAVLITDPGQACDEIEALWNSLRGSFFRPLSFRNGEGWHCAATLATVERIGFRWDSTAIPGRIGGEGHPMDWAGTPNHPFFPDRVDVRVPGPPRPLLEIPMNSWCVPVSYDRIARPRYINPAIHEELFDAALRMLGPRQWDHPNIWVLILHPDEMLASEESDLLYAHSAKSVCRNLIAFARAMREAGAEVQFLTLSAAGECWREAEAP